MEPDLRAEAKRMLEERQGSEVHFHIVNGGPCECERCKRGIPPGPNDWTINVVHVGGGGDASHCEVRHSKFLI